MVASAKLRSITAQLQKYETSINVFKLRFNGYPGDMPNATSFWPGETTNGNGDGRYWTYAAVSEGYAAWDQLSLEGMISGTYSGISGPEHTIDHTVIGTNIPALEADKSLGISIRPGYVPGNANWFATEYGEGILTAGSEVANYWNAGRSFTPLQAYQIDQKIDSSNSPAKGKIRSLRDNCTNGADMNDLDAEYNFSNTGEVCNLFYVLNL